MQILYPVAIRFFKIFIWPISLRWRHNGRDGGVNHHPHDCLLNRLFMRRSKKTSKLRLTGLCEGNSPVTGEFPAQRASNAENFSIRWRHHVLTFARPFRSIPPKSIITRFATLRITFLTILDVTGWNIRGCQEFKFKLFIPSTASNHSIVFLVNFCCFDPLRAGPNLREVWLGLWYLQAGDILISISIWNSIIYNVSLGHICERRILALSVHGIIYIYIYVCVCVLRLDIIHW